MISRDLRKIITIEELNSTINFLKKGFNWSSKRSFSIKKSLLKHNNILGFYGFMLLNKESEIIGAILTPYQGVYKEQSIINLSSWYVLPRFRGINSIFMAKFITKKLKNYVITNFSPNKAALNIFESVGFKRMKTCTTNYFLQNHLKGIFKILLSRKINVLSDVSSNNNKNDSHDGLFLRDSFYINLYLKKEILKVLINRSSIERKVGLIIISLPRLHILWSSNNSLLNENLNRIIPFLMAKYISPIVSNHCNESKLINSINIWRYHLQYSQAKNYLIHPIGGEYSINL